MSSPVAEVAKKAKKEPASSRDSILYKIVRFENNEVSIVPQSWLMLDPATKAFKCSYPMKENDYQKAELVRKKSKVKSRWTKFDIEVIGTANTLEEAKRKEKIASDESSTCDVDAEYERQKEEADKQSADKKSRRIRKRKRDPDFVDDNESSDSFDSDDENGEDNLYALTPEVPKDNLFPNQFANNIQKFTSAEGVQKGDGTNNGDSNMNDSGFHDTEHEKNKGTAKVEIVEPGELSGLKDDSKKYEDNVAERNEVEIAEPFELSGLKDDSKKNKDNVYEGNEGELTEQTELSELGGEPEKNEQYLIADDDGQWFIVKFKDTDQYSAIPSRWLTKDKKNSHWPPSDNTITYYCLRRSKPVEGWTLRCISDIIGQKETLSSAWEVIDELKKSNQMDRPKPKLASNIRISKEKSNNIVNEALQPIKKLADLTNHDIEQMEPRDMMACSLYGFKEITTNQAKIMNQLKMHAIGGVVATTGTYSLDSIRKQFPKKTLKDLMKLEEHLGDENKVGFKARVIEFLKDVGGATGHQSVNKMLAKIITNSVASNFNYTGKGSKKAAFGELHIWKIISDIAVEKFKKVEGDNYDFLKAIKSCSHWLKYAPFRDVKKKKQKKTTQKTLEELAAAEESDEHHDSDELVD